jgi:hypothetical protein
VESEALRFQPHKLFPKLPSRIKFIVRFQLIWMMLIFPLFRLNKSIDNRLSTAFRAPADLIETSFNAVAIPLSQWLMPMGWTSSIEHAV